MQTRQPCEVPGHRSMVHGPRPLSKIPELLSKRLKNGIEASAFAIVFLFEAFGVALPSLSLKAQHPNFVTSEYTKAVCLFAAVGIGIFAVYEIFFLPS